MNNFMTQPLSWNDNLFVLKKCIKTIFSTYLLLEIDELFVEGDIFHEDMEEGIHRFDENLRHRCDFFFEGYRAYLVSGQQCIVYESTLKSYLWQAVEWAKENRPEHKQFLIDFEIKYLSDVD